MSTLPNGLPAATADTKDPRDPQQWKGLRVITEDEINALAQSHHNLDAQTPLRNFRLDLRTCERYDRNETGNVRSPRPRQSMAPHPARQSHQRDQQTIWQEIHHLVFPLALRTRILNAMIRLFAACLACLAPFAAAQEKPSSKDTLIRFTSFGLPDDSGEYVLASGETKSDPFAIPSNGFSLPVTSPAGSKTFTLGNAKDASFSSLATVKLPDTGERFLVILLPEKDQTLRAIVVRADDPEFRPGQIMIMNLAPETFTADLGDQKLTFAPDSRTIFHPQRTDNLSNYQVRFFYIKDDKPKRFAASLWPYFDDKRTFVFLYMDKATGSPTLRSIDEFTDWLK